MGYHHILRNTKPLCSNPGKACVMEAFFWRNTTNEALVLAEISLGWPRNHIHNLRKLECYEN